ncbi:sugar ABC transporter permease [Paenibacillus sp. MY03]|jgi:putative aldouronate transport system permease protein|uniref:carbohydrate ABC transporter permease n=1 Tax=Paenibacillus sp. MY03 TaxID=302980 RepID=UPI000B3C82F4|nr:carbohydrate ABC transporter permease [Paenibacillus sp. MY03]OUS75005.1 sugar ABC transporter permease [Paenibacillus sp. MY03]
MRKKRSAGELSFDVLNTAIMLALIATTLYPFAYVLFASLSDAVELMRHRGIMWMPQGFSLEAYKTVLSNDSIISGYRNTIFYVVVGSAFNLLMTSLGAYVLSRRNVMLKKQIMIMIVITMFFGGGLIPTYLLINDLGLYNTRAALIIPGAISTWNLIVMRTSFQGVPYSLEESARIDGANDFTILFRVIIPLSLPVLAVMTLFYAVGHWNSYFGALIYLTDASKFPLQLVLREVLLTTNMEEWLTGVPSDSRHQVAQTIKYATIMVATVPILILYPFLQKYFVKGVMIGSLKE